MLSAGVRVCAGRRVLGAAASPLGRVAVPQVAVGRALHTTLRAPQLPVVAPRLSGLGLGGRGAGVVRRISSTAARAERQIRSEFREPKSSLEKRMQDAIKEQEVRQHESARGGKLG